MVPAPLYKEVKQRIIENLISGKWKAGDKIPTEPELAKHYAVGIATIRAAVADLVAAQVLRRIQGKGTFVSESKSPYRFSNFIDSNGTREIPTRVLLSFRSERSSGDLAKDLQLAKYDSSRKIFSLWMLFLIHGTPVAVSNASIPAALFPNLSRKHIQNEKLPLYAFYQKHFNVNVVRVQADISAVVASPCVYKHLKLSSAVPLLEIERIAYTFQDIPVEYRRIWINSSIYKFRVDQGSAI